MTAPIPSEVFLDRIRREAVRVLSFVDREPFSPTCGCMDRTYWAWKFTDFPGARFQEGLCALSFLYSTEFDNNPYYQNPRLLRWIAEGFEFWCDIQRKSGDFDEAYPFERSLAATAFTSFYISEAWHFLDDALPTSTAARFKSSLRRAGEWLLVNDETHGFLSNHLAAAAAALYHAFLICCDERFRVRSRYFLQKILDHQSDEGWYDEYGGADPGYQTHGSFYLARYLELSDDERLEPSLEKSFGFLAHFIHADRSLGGEYTSRNTQTYYPAAFEMMSRTSGRAHWIAREMLSAVSELSAAGHGTVDAYNYYPLLNNYVFAYRACMTEGHRAASAKAPERDVGATHFPKAGILKVRRPKYEVYVGLKKGGVVKAFDRESRKIVLNDCGYIGKLPSGKLVSSQWIDEDTQVELLEDRVIIRGKFFRINTIVMKPLMFLGFRGFSLTLGRIRWFAYLLKSILVKVLIYRKKDFDLRYSREIRFDDDALIVRDQIVGAGGSKLESLKRADVFVTIHMGSSRYFLPNEIEPIAGGPEKDVDLTQAANGGVILERKIRLASE